MNGPEVEGEGREGEGKGVRKPNEARKVITKTRFLHYPVNNIMVTQLKMFTYR